MPLSGEKKEKYITGLQRILKPTEYEGGDLDAKSIEKFVSEGGDQTEEFFEWIVNNITDENCLTAKELERYNKLKDSCELVPEEDLDRELQYFFSETPKALFAMDLKKSFQRAEKELMSLKSLEKFLKKTEKKEEMKKVKQTNEVDLDSRIFSDLDDLNLKLNSAFENYSKTWCALRLTATSQHRDNNGVIKEINVINKKIEEYLTQQLTNIFSKETELPLFTDSEHYLVFQSLRDATDEIIYVTYATEIYLHYCDRLSQLEAVLKYSCSPLSMGEIRTHFEELQNPKELFKKTLTSKLETENTWMYSLQTEDAKLSRLTLNNILEILSQIINILEEKHIYHRLLQLIGQMNVILKKLQFEKLLHFKIYIEEYLKDYNNRMDLMTSYKAPSIPNLKREDLEKIMFELHVKDFNVTDIDEAMSDFYRNYLMAFNSLEKEFDSFQSIILKRLQDCKEHNRNFAAGRQFEEFNQIFKTITSLTSSLESFENKKRKLEQIINEYNKSSEKEGDTRNVWMMFLNKPEEIAAKLSEMESRLNILMSVNKTDFK